MTDFTMVLTVYISVIIFVFGTVIGSFLNVLIYRLPNNIGFKKGRSMCTSCGHELCWKDLFPLFSWIFLGGKCRYCKARIPVRYPAVEALNAVMYVLSYLFLTGGNGFTGLRLSLLAFFAVFSALIVVIWVDFEHQIIPDSMWITIAAAGVVRLADEFITGGFDRAVLIERVAGIFAVGGLFFLIALLSGGRYMGGGDIKLMAAAGLVLGWKLAFLSLVLGAFAGVIYYFVSMLVKKTKMKGVVPFGPFLSAGIIVSLFTGDKLIDAYMGLF